MSTTTTNYKLVKPSTSEKVDVNIINANMDTLDTHIQKNYDKVISLGEQLIVNGNGIMGNNTNFSTFWTYDGSQANNSPGSFKRVGFANHASPDQFLAVDPTKKYIWSFDIKSLNETAVCYSFIEQYDIDFHSIGTPQVQWLNGSLTTLAQDLKAGDTVAYLTDASGWKSKNYYVNLVFYNYSNSYGYTYPPGTYSRNYFRFYTGGYQPPASSFDTTNNTVTFNTPYTGETIPAGTYISLGGIGGEKYQGLVAGKPPKEWTRYNLTFTGMDENGVFSNNAFSPGVAYLKLAFNLDYTNTKDTTWITNLSFRSVADMSEIEETYAKKTDIPPVVSFLSGTSSNPVQNKVIYNALLNKLNADGTAVKAIADANGNNIVNTYATKSALQTLQDTVDGLDIPDEVMVDSELSSTSMNPVQNKVIQSALEGKQASGDYATNTSLTNGLATKQKAITLSTVEPTASDGENGDFWAVYE